MEFPQSTTASNPPLIKSHFLDLLDDPFTCVEWAWREVAVPGSSETKRLEFPTSFSDQTCQIVADKYLRMVGGVQETSFKQTTMRVTWTITDHGFKSGYYKDEDERDAHFKELVYLILTQRMAFNSPVWFNVGVTENPACSACFITPIGDSMEEILEAGKVMGRIFNGGSGNGSSYSQLRGSNESLSCGGTSSGPVAFIRSHDGIGGAIKSGGKNRRSAGMVVLDSDHPDIKEFVIEKATAENAAHALVEAGFPSDFRDASGAYGLVPNQNANHSVRVDDAFMTAAIAENPTDRAYSLINRVGGDVAEVIDASELLATISESAHVSGDPGMQYDALIQEYNTIPNTGRINATNPCCFVGETLVKTDDDWWSLDELEQLFREGKSGPQVWTWNVELGRPEFSKIVNVWKSGHTSNLVEVTTEKGLLLKSTPEHRYLAKSGEWIMAQNLTSGILLRGDIDDRVESVRHIELMCDIDANVYRTPVFDLEVEGQHNFMVRSAGSGSDHGVFVHNSEFCHIDDTSCNLASLNLVHFFDDPSRMDRGLDDYFSAIDTTILAMEILCDLGGYPTEGIDKMTRASRPLGIGFSNLGALCMRRGLAYDSDEARNLAAMITSALTGRAYRQSALIARDRGAFTEFEKNRDEMLNIIDKHRRSWRDQVMVTTVANPKIGQEGYALARISSLWNQAYELGHKYGFRNSQASVLAPTGTIAFLMGCDTTGIEPSTGLVLYKTLVGGGVMKLANQSVSIALDRLDYDIPTKARILKHIQETGAIDGAELIGLNPDHLPIFDTAFPAHPGGRTIHWKGHIDMMAACQPFLSGAISKTASLPADSTPADFRAIYIAAWKAGLKAVAIYRDGSKASQPLSTTSDQKSVDSGSEKLPSKKLAHDQKSVYPQSSQPIHPSQSSQSNRLDSDQKAGPTRMRLPDTRSAQTKKFQIGGDEGYITTGYYDDGELGEVFVRINKQGSPISGLLDALAISVSIGLQYGVPLERYADKFIGTRFEPSGFTGEEGIRSASSPLDYVFRYLMSVHDQGHGQKPVKRIEQKSDPENQPSESRPLNTASAAYGPPCIECGGSTVRAGTCFVCMDCGSTTGCG